MNYVLLIQSDEALMPAFVTAALQSRQSAWGKALSRAGKLLAADRLQGPSTARTLRAGDSGAFVTDGPFVETKEHLGGYYLVQLGEGEAGFAEAIELAEAMPLSEGCDIWVSAVKDAGRQPRAGEHPGAQVLLIAYEAPLAVPTDDPAVRVWMQLEPDTKAEAVRTRDGARIAAGATIARPWGAALLDGPLDAIVARARGWLAPGGVLEARPVVIYR